MKLLSGRTFKRRNFRDEAAKQVLTWCEIHPTEFYKEDILWRRHHLLKCLDFSGEHVLERLWIFSLKFVFFFSIRLHLGLCCSFTQYFHGFTSTCCSTACATKTKSKWEHFHFTTQFLDSLFLYSLHLETAWLSSGVQCCLTSSCSATSLWWTLWTARLEMQLLLVTSLIRVWSEEAYGLVFINEQVEKKVILRRGVGVV